ncbi:unnamed protein product [Lymnaea stagnalis]|uniref:Transmembrane protein 164 n=1 Tax=Lymnaea stagnalis TaxID=6523 RepID=A0AAV2HPU2_LYMST
MALPADYHRTDGWFDWAYKGVDHSFPGNGGLECRDFLSISQRCWESLGASVVALLALIVAYPRLQLPRPCSCAYRRKPEPLGKRLLLLLMCLTFGIELGFKLATRQMIWIGNPCHLATMMQIFILAAPPSRIVTAAFRLHMHMLTGAPIAILFPVINTRLLPFETGVYFLQHFLMLIIPFYLMKTGDPFIPERLGDFSWSMISFGFLFIYHFLPLQLVAYASQVNLNNMLCPAVSDPFHGKFYRLFAICHQFILIPTLGKLFVVLARSFNILPYDNPPDASNMADVLCYESRYCGYNMCCSSSASQAETCPDTGDSTENDSGITGTLSRSNPLGQFAGCSCLFCSSQAGCCRGKVDNAAYDYSNSCEGRGEGPMPSVMHIVNGRIVEGKVNNEDPVVVKRGVAAEVKVSNHPSEANQDEDEQDKTPPVSDLSKKRNGHTKSH